MSAHARFRPFGAAAAGSTQRLRCRYKRLQEQMNGREEEEQAIETQLCSSMPRLFRVLRSSWPWPWGRKVRNACFQRALGAGMLEQRERGHGWQTHSTLCALCTS